MAYVAYVSYDGRFSRSLATPAPSLIAVYVRKMPRTASERIFQTGVADAALSAPIWMQVEQPMRMVVLHG